MSNTGWEISSVTSSISSPRSGGRGTVVVVVSATVVVVAIVVVGAAVVVVVVVVSTTVDDVAELDDAAGSETHAATSMRQVRVAARLNIVPFRLASVPERRCRGQSQARGHPTVPRFRLPGSPLQA